MQLVTLKCPTCNANIQVNSELTQGTCNYCGATFLIDDEVKKRDQLSEEDGFNFEKGRIRAQKEEEERQRAENIRLAQEEFKRRQLAEQERLANVNKSYKIGFIKMLILSAAVVCGVGLIYLIAYFLR